MAKKGTRKPSDAFDAGNDSLYRILFEMDSDALFLIEISTGRILEANPAAESLYGFSRKQLLDMRNTDLSAEPDETRRAMSEHQTRIPVRHHRKADGTVFPVDITVRHFTWEEKEVVLASIRDITQHRKKERDREPARERLAQTMRTIPSGVVRVNAQGAIVYANPMAEEMLGLTRSKILERKYNDPEWSITDPDGGPFPEKELPFVRVMRGKKPVHDVRHAIQWPDGIRKVLSINGAPMIDEQGEVAEAVFAMLDVTDAIRTHRQLDRAHQDLREQHKALECLYSISKLVEETDEPDASLQGTVDILATTLLGKTSSAVRLTMHGREFTRGRIEGRQEVLAEDILVGGESKARLEVFQANRTGDGRGAREFDRVLLKVVAERIGHVLERMEAAQEIQEQKELLVATGEIARIGGWTYDPAEDRLIWTEQTRRIHEMESGEQPSLDKALEFFPSEERKKLSGAIDRALEHGEPYDLELRFVTARGNLLWVRDICRPEVEQDRTVRLKGTFQDITERKNAQELDRQRSFALEVIFELTQKIGYTLNYEKAMILILTLLHRAIFFDLAGILYPGQEGMSLILRTRCQCPKNASDKVLADMSRTMGRLGGEAPEPGEVSLRLLNLDGDSCSSQVGEIESAFMVPIYRQQDQLFGIIYVGAEAKTAFSQDQISLLYSVAAQASQSIDRLHAFLEEEKRGLQQLVESIPDGILLLDAEHRVMVTNPTADLILDKLGNLGARGELVELSGLPLQGMIDTSADPGTPFSVCLLSTRHGRFFEVLHEPLDSGPLAGGLLLILRDVTRTRRDQEELRRSEEKFRSLYDSIRDAILVADTDRRITDLNPAFTDLFGYTLDELRGKKTSFVYESEEEFQRMGKLIRKHEAGQNFVFVVHYRKKNGEVFPGETNVFQLRTSHGEVVGAIGLIRDISERLEAEERICNLARFPAEDPHPVLRISKENILLYANQASRHLKKHYGLRLNKSLPKAFRALIEPVFRKESQRAMEIKAGDHTYAMSVSRVEDRDYVNLYCMEITDRKKAERTIRENQELLRSILAGLKAAFFVIDTESCTIVEANSSAEEIVDLSRESIIGHTCHEILNITECEPEKCRALNRQKVTRLDQERVLTLEDGTMKPVSTSLLPVEIDGRPHLVSIHFDITRRKSLERQLAYAQKLESIGQLAAGIAHEVNTPAQYLENNVSYLKEAFHDFQSVLDALLDWFAEDLSEKEPGERARSIRELLEEKDLEYLREDIPQTLEESLEGLSRIAGIVSAMKRFAHPGGETRKALDLNSSVEDTITVARNEWKYVAEIETHLDPSLPPVPCVPGDLSQIVLNLVINAAHAIGAKVGNSGEKGLITVTTGRDDGHAFIRVSDTGTGIPEEHRLRIFDPFFTTKEVGKGTGQGLSLVYSAVVERHGGTIDFSTEAEKGTTFEVRLPLEEKGGVG